MRGPPRLHHFDKLGVFHDHIRSTCSGAPGHTTRAVIRDESEHSSVCFVIHTHRTSCGTWFWSENANGFSPVPNKCSSLACVARLPILAGPRFFVPMTSLYFSSPQQEIIWFLRRPVEVLLALLSCLCRRLVAVGFLHSGFMHLNIRQIRPSSQSSIVGFSNSAYSVELEFCMHESLWRLVRVAEDATALIRSPRTLSSCSWFMPIHGLGGGTFLCTETAGSSSETSSGVVESPLADSTPRPLVRCRFGVLSVGYCLALRFWERPGCCDMNDARW